MAVVSGLGGVFFKSRDTDASKRWYEEVLGLGGDWGIMLPWKADGTGEAFSLVSPFKGDSDYFDPSPHPFMINLRVDDMDATLADIGAKGVKVLGTQDEEYGRFAWILDPDEIKIELWQQLGPAPPT